MSKQWGKRKRDGQSYIKGDQSVPVSGGSYDVVPPPTKLEEIYLSDLLSRSKMDSTTITGFDSELRGKSDTAKKRYLLKIYRQMYNSESLYYRGVEQHYGPYGRSSSQRRIYVKDNLVAVVDSYEDRGMGLQFFNRMPYFAKLRTPKEAVDFAEKHKG